ncbi:MAG TPA: fatty acid desaturase [Chthonomonadaceae bacterium]|nr:fatty acid desaturase [Chthonomonadaceae bacterium]
MSLVPGELKNQVVQSQWYRALAKYEKPDVRKAIGQLFNTFIPYIALWVVMVWIIRQHLSLWFLCPLVALAAGLLVRVFIFQHDCGHGSFLASHKANRLLGYLCGVLTFTPYDDWKHEHAAHHAAAQDLDRRGMGDIPTMTVEEYRNASLLKRWYYRLFRHPFFLFLVGPAIQFVIVHRFPHRRAGKRERMSVLITNLALVSQVLIASWTIGLRTYLLIQMPIIVIAAAMGVWLFYVQHQYEDTYWAPHEDWDPIRAALEGSSHYRLPKILQWFSGNIGLHHIHHLRPRIPNYHLQQCYDEIPELQKARSLTLWESLRCMGLNLWDEQNRRLVSFRALRAQRK